MNIMFYQQKNVDCVGIAIGFMQSFNGAKYGK